MVRRGVPRLVRLRVQVKNLPRAAQLGGDAGRVCTPGGKRTRAGSLSLAPFRQRRGLRQANWTKAHRPGGVDTGAEGSTLCLAWNWVSFHLSVSWNERLRCRGTHLPRL